MHTHPRGPRRLALALVVGSIVGAVAALAPGGAAAQSADIVASYLGEWLIASDDGKPGCRIRLTKEKTIGGMAATPNETCKANIPKLEHAAAWRIESGVTFVDATRKTILTFTEDETTLLKTRGDEVPNYMMVKAPQGVDRAPHAPAIFGNWAMQRPGGPVICRLTFLNKPPPGGEESFGLTLEPGCDAAVKRLKLASWRIEDFSLMLYGTDGEGLRLEPTAQGFEKAKSERGKPLHLVRAK